MHKTNIIFSNQKKKNIFVFGASRGGTSCVTLILKSLGINVYGSDNPYHEDTSFSNVTELKTRIIEYNKEKLSWAIKKPSLLFNISEFEHLLVNPHFIFVYRNILSVCSSSISRSKDPFNLVLLRTTQYYNEMGNYAARYSTVPILYISYEDVLKNPEKNIKDISSYCGIKTSPATIENIKKESVSQKKYLLSSATKKTFAFEKTDIDYSLIDDFKANNEELTKIFKNEYIDLIQSKINYLNKLLDIIRSNNPNSIYCVHVSRILIDMYSEITSNIHFDKFDSINDLINNKTKEVKSIIFNSINKS
jgi:hypothetical protein